MTVTLPDQDTDTARRLLEQLDDAIPCDVDDCTAEATLIVHWKSVFCDCRPTTFVCEPCLEIVREGLRDPVRRRWGCKTCGQSVLGRWAFGEVALIDRIEPIR